MGRSFVVQSVCSAAPQGDNVVNYEALRVKPACVVVNRLAADVTRGVDPGGDPAVSVPLGGAPTDALTAGCDHVIPWPAGDCPRAVDFPYPPGCCDPPGVSGGVPPD